VRDLLYKNITFFKAKNPSLYRQLSSHKVSKYKAVVEGGRVVNIINSSGRPVYPYNIERYCEAQVREFFETETARYQDFETVNYELLPYKSKHHDLINVYSPYKFTDKRDFSPNAEDNLNTLVIFGLGNGRHIELLLARKAVRNLIIVDDGLDFLYVSLHCVDWENIYSEVESRGGQVCLVLRSNQEAVTKALSAYLSGAKRSATVKFYKYFHIENNILRETNSLIERLFFIANFGLGFYDDERVGFAHTVDHLVNKRNFLMDFGLDVKFAIGDREVFVLGNGPSLDNIEDYLKENRESLFIVSCGTTLGSLYKKGIKPDLHLEQERPEVVSKIIKKTTDASYRNGIKLCALNTVHPKVFELFDSNRSYVLFKPNDFAADSIFTRVLGDLKYDSKTIMFSNPTVTNFGIALMGYLGITEFSIAGIDYGSKASGVAHSKDSIYSEKGAQNLFTKRVPGSRVPWVWSSSLLHRSLEVTEEAISYFDLNIKNYSDGALIKGCKVADVPTVNSETLTDALQGKYTIEGDMVNNALKGMVSESVYSYAEIYRKILSAIESHLTVYTENVCSIYVSLPSELNENAVLEYLDAILIPRHEGGAYYEEFSMLFCGTINTFSAIGSSICLNRSDLDYRYFVESIHQKLLVFLAQAQHDLSNNFCEFDVYVETSKSIV